MARRLWEVDVARGVALGLMLVFNWTFALHFLDVWTIRPRDSWLYWWLFPRFIGFMFVFIVGVSLTLSVNRLRRRRPEGWRAIARRKYPERGLRILALGIAIIVAMYVLYPERFVYFGVLHLIGVSVALSVPFLRRERAALVTGLVVVGAAPWVGAIPVESRLLGVIGFGAQVPTLDHFPIVPWTGVVLLGIWTGHTAFPAGRRRLALPDIGEYRLLAPPLRGLQFVGRHTLAIYLAHQPALGALLLVLGYDVL